MGQGGLSRRKRDILDQKKKPVHASKNISYLTNHLEKGGACGKR